MLYPVVLLFALSSLDPVVALSDQSVPTVVASQPASTVSPSGPISTFSSPNGTFSSPNGTFSSPNSTSSSPNGTSSSPTSPPNSSVVPSPTVHLSNGLFSGFAVPAFTLGSSTASIDKFLGIPFATATRFGLPSAPSAMAGVTQQATAFGSACPSQTFNLPTPTGCPSIPIVQGDSATSENCLSVNVIRPSNIPNNVTLPVLFWIYGGAFQVGDTAMYNVTGTSLVNQSMFLDERIIYVSANYRLDAFGFLGGNEVATAKVGNLGLRDQRFAMQWIQANIGIFGGDKSRVTIMEQSAGAISVGLQLFANGGDPAGLFRAAFMESGSPLPLRNISDPQPQAIYDRLVNLTACSGPKNFTCLGDLPLEQLQAAINQMSSVVNITSLNLAWRPYVDGDFLKGSPLSTFQNLNLGAFANVPLIAGNTDDEGTIFSLSEGLLSLTTPNQTSTYIHDNYVPSAATGMFAPITTFYPSDPADGSPFGTGDKNNITAQYKRIAALQGDLYFQAPRRNFLAKFSQSGRPTWGYLYRRLKETPCFGSFHGSGLPEWFGVPKLSTFQGSTALLNFVNNSDPNKGVALPVTWPQYMTETNALMLNFSGNDTLTNSSDTYRAEGIGFWVSLFPNYA